MSNKNFLATVLVIGVFGFPKLWQRITCLILQILILIFL